MTTASFTIDIDRLPVCPRHPRARTVVRQCEAGASHDRLECWWCPGKTDTMGEAL